MKFENIEIKYVTLKVSDLRDSIHFYETIIGLNLIDNTQNEATLGIGLRPMVKLIADDRFEVSKYVYTGLYHMAFLIEDVYELVSILNHLQQQNQMFSVEDHGYSKALYLRDPDRNGIEIYYDRPKDRWIKDSENRIIAQDRTVDLEKLMKVAHTPFTKLKASTVFGHLHLRIKEVIPHIMFYKEVLGLDLHQHDDQAVFMSKDGYHHQIAGNLWRKPVDSLPMNNLGLKSYRIALRNTEDIKRKTKNQYQFKAYYGYFELTDPNGIKIEIEELI